MFDTLAKLTPALVSGFGIVIAALVYRLNADKLFLEMLTARRESVREVLDAAYERDIEASALGLNVIELAAYNLPQQSRFWQAQEAAQGLFGREVGQTLLAMDDALREAAGARIDLRNLADNKAPVFEAIQRHTDAIEALGKARERFATAVKPYTMLGRRGLGTRARLALWRQDRQKR